MHSKSTIFFLAFIYIGITLIIFYFFTPHGHFNQKLYLFYKDPGIADRVHSAIVEDTSGNHALLARLFENKANFSLDNMLVSLSRTIDPTFFFSLSPTTYYGNSYYTFFPGIFFPFFVIAVIVLIRKWDVVHKKYWYLLPLFGISLLVDVLFVPYTAPLKLIPLFITIQLITFFGMYEIWAKK